MNLAKQKGWVNIMGLQVQQRLKNKFTGYLMLRKHNYSCKKWKHNNNVAPKQQYGSCFGFPASTELFLNL